ncbi:MAG TPA: hypothetical protein VKE51_15645 [Vicinamibacterales bacterium]|nr:hypothetical protein [Vicinamibacterales bacterium]
MHGQFSDPQGIRHGVEVEAESLYEAVVLAVKRFREDPWLPQVSATTALDVDVRDPSTKHAITLQQVERWLATTSASPLEKSKKAKLKMMLVPRADNAVAPHDV